MSVQALTWVFEHSASSGHARLVLLSIANHADREGANAYPSRETIAHESRCSLATVKRALRDLYAIGELDWVSRAAERQSNHYWMPAMRHQTGIHSLPTWAQMRTLMGST